MRSYLRALKQATTYLGLVVIAAVWTGVLLLVQQEREHASYDAAKTGSNLTRVFEEYIARVVDGTDSQLSLLRNFYEQNPEHFDFAGLTDSAKTPDNLIIQFSIVGPDGIVKLTSLGPIQSRVDLTHSASFQAHVNDSADKLYIGLPVIGLISGKPTVYLTRRLTAPDGSFAGTIGAALDVSRLERFYSSVDVGPGGVISLVGFDGIIRARSGHDAVASGFIGQSIADRKVTSLFRQNPSGNYWNTPQSTRFESIRRLISYRVIEGLPLIAIVGLAESDIFEAALSKTSQYDRIGFLLTAIVLVVIGFAARRQMQLSSATAALQQTHSRFDAALENMPHGLSMFDREQRLILCNRRYAEMYGLTLDQTKPGASLRTILEARVAAGHCPHDAENYVADCLEGTSLLEPCYVVHELSNGSVFAINRRVLPGGGSIAVHQDITAIRLMEANADSASQELIEKQYAIDQAVIVGVTDVKGRITYANNNFCQISGYTRDELLGADHRILNSGAHPKKFFREMYRQIASGHIWRAELCNRAKDGSTYWVDTIIVPQLGPSGKPIAYMAIRIDITARKRAEAEVSYVARHDALTGIANRAVLQERMEEALARLRQHGEAFSVFMLDLDGFKYINDTLGHSGGDELLKHLAHRLKSSLRETETVARLGGDEFAIIQSGETNLREGAIGLAVRLLEIIAKPFTIDGRIVTIGTSIGIALAPENGVERGDLLKKADLALYRVKSEGRNNFNFFDEKMSKDVAGRAELLSDMRSALTRNEFELHYQPIIDAKTSRPCGVEALVRWRHPTAGLLSPDRFIWLAEDTGLMEPLGEWILERACTDAALWPETIKVAVNLSAVQFRSGTLFDVILCILVETGLSPQRLELEITESMFLHNKESYGVVIQQLKNLGISIALDDFGTGYSSLSYLTTFAFDKIKIDKSFTQGLSNRADCAAVVASVLTLARGLDMTVTAEGVETKAQFELLRVAGVNQVQGYLFGRPVPVAELDFGALESTGQADAAA